VMKRIFNLIKKAYYRLFYFYFGIEKRNGRGGEETDSFAAIAALIPMVVLCFANFFTLLYVIARFVLPFSLPSDALFVIIIIIDIGLNGWIFLHNKQYLKIKAMFRGENENKKLKRALWCILFSLASLFFMFILMGIFGNPWTSN